MFGFAALMMFQVEKQRLERSRRPPASSVQECRPYSVLSFRPYIVDGVDRKLSNSKQLAKMYRTKVISVQTSGCLIWTF